MDVHSRIATLIDGFGWQQVGIGYDVSSFGVFVVYFDLGIPSGEPLMGKALIMRYSDCDEAKMSVARVNALLEVYSGKHITAR